MNAEFNWWLLIVGLVIGAGVVWLILADSSRREVDLDRRERAGEARWIGDELRAAGRSVDDATVDDVLELHAAYLGAPPPDEPIDEQAAVPDVPEIAATEDAAAAWAGGDDAREPAITGPTAGGGDRRPA